MKVNNGTVGTTLIRNILKKNVRLKRTARQEASTTSWIMHALALGKREMLSPIGLQSQQSENRAAHIEELQMQVIAGIYKIDSALLAKSMLSDQTHFLDESWD
jgi:anti-sigma28 factor (negative regulator of flagellin synthesis)